MFNFYRDFDMPGYPPKSGPSVVMVSIEIGVRSRDYASGEVDSG